LGKLVVSGNAGLLLLSPVLARLLCRECAKSGWVALIDCAGVAEPAK
jgi:hypothetical protein